jgi:OsmC-like protein
MARSIGTEEPREIQGPLKRRYRDDPAAALITLEAEGDLDWRGTLAVDKEAPVGFSAIRLRFDLESEASGEELATVVRLTERYCVVFQTLARSHELRVSWERAWGAGVSRETRQLLPTGFTRTRQRRLTSRPAA